MENKTLRGLLTRSNPAGLLLLFHPCSVITHLNPGCQNGLNKCWPWEFSCRNLKRERCGARSGLLRGTRNPGQIITCRVTIPKLPSPRANVLRWGTKSSQRKLRQGCRICKWYPWDVGPRICSRHGEKQTLGRVAGGETVGDLSVLFPWARGPDPIPTPSLECIHVSRTE